VRICAATFLLLCIAFTAPAHAGAPAQPATAEALADELASALAASDFPRVRELVSPNGFNWAREGSGGLPTKSRDEAVEFLRAESGGRLNVAVRTRPVFESPVPWGSRAVSSTWTNFGNVPQQSVHLILTQVAGTWYWAGGYVLAAQATSPTAAPAPTAPPAPTSAPVSALPSTTTIASTAGPTVAAAGPASTGENDLWLLLTLGAIVIVIAGGVVALLARRGV